jgi:hypothetical protein
VNELIQSILVWLNVKPQGSKLKQVLAKRDEICKQIEEGIKEADRERDAIMLEIRRLEEESLSLTADISSATKLKCAISG